MLWRSAFLEVSAQGATFQSKGPHLGTEFAIHTSDQSP